MPIARNAGGGGKFVSEAGEYKVTVEKIEMKTPKKEKLDPKTNKPMKRQMLVVHFTTDSEQEIAGYYVKDVAFHMAALTQLKAACGLEPNESSDELIGKQCGILVEMQEPNEQGKSFASIVGYGPADQVGEERGSGETHSMINDGDEVPF